MKTANRRVYTVRRWAVVLIAVAVLIGVLMVVLPANAAVDSTPSVNTATVTVGQDENLWTIAKTISGGQGTDAVVEQIQELNNLSGSVVHPGQELQVPTR